MRPDRVVVASPFFDNDPSLLQGVEDLAIEQLVAELRIEALAIAVLPRTKAGIVRQSDLSLSYRTARPDRFSNAFWTTDNH
jgi:hypothetical protein